MAQIVGIFVAAFSPFEANSLDFCSKIFLSMVRCFFLQMVLIVRIFVADFFSPLMQIH
jgi:hypothetical protein